MSQFPQTPTRYSFILATGFALLLFVAAPATEAAAGMTGDTPKSAADASMSILWQTGLGWAELDRPAQTPPVSAAPAEEAHASLSILWQTGLGWAEIGSPAQTPPVSAAPPEKTDASLSILWQTGLGWAETTTR